jgi:hypothetical protein
MKLLERTVLGLVLGAILWAMGCGGDSTPTPPKKGTIQVRNGTWQIHEEVTYTGVDSCLARSPVTTDTAQVICSVSVTLGTPDFPFTCDLQNDAGNVTFNCRLRVDLGPCLQIADAQGSGIVTDTTFQLSMRLTQRVTAKDSQNNDFCQLYYGRFADACTTWIASNGSWIDSVGSFTCPSDTLSKSVPFDRILSGMIRAGETEPTSP